MATLRNKKYTALLPSRPEKCIWKKRLCCLAARHMGSIVHWGGQRMFTTKAMRLRTRRLTISNAAKRPMAARAGQVPSRRAPAASLTLAGSGKAAHWRVACRRPVARATPACTDPARVIPEHGGKPRSKQAVCLAFRFIAGESLYRSLWSKRTRRVPGRGQAFHKYVAKLLTQGAILAGGHVEALGRAR